MKASESSILEYQSDQPSTKPLRPLSLLLHPQQASMSECSPASRVRALRAPATPPWTPAARSDRVQLL